MLAADCAAKADSVAEGMRALIDDELKALEAKWPSSLPEGVIHADLFPDNVLFVDNELSGIIDFYFACCDALAYDLAVTLNAWCFESGRLVQFDQGARAGRRVSVEAQARAGGARGDAAALPRCGAALPADAALRLAESRSRGAGAAEGPARIRAAADASIAPSAAPTATDCNRNARTNCSGPRTYGFWE